MRGDLADVRLAEQVFAPHYAAPLPTLVQRATQLFADRALSETIATLVPGDGFEVLELAGNHAWGLATAHGLAGYVDRATLDRVPPQESDAA